MVQNVESVKTGKDGRPLCKCGHDYYDHDYDEGWVGVEEFSLVGSCDLCECKDYESEETDDN